MSRIADFILRLIGQDEASDVIEHVADLAEPLEDGVEVPVTEQGGEQTADALQEVSELADEVDGKSSEVEVSAPGAKEAASDLGSFSNAADVMGGAGVTGAAGVSAISAASVGAVGAIGAAVKVAKESVDAYVAMGIAAQQGGAAVGMSTEEYSRWIEVADDFMIEASALQGALTGLNRKIVQGSEAFAAYGISTVDANGAMRSTNDVMLDVIGVMTEMENPQEAMRVGMELMGPAFKKLAPLIGKTEEEMRAYLASVDEGLVVTDEWAANSLETAQAQDELRDSLKVVVVSIGEMVAALAPVIVELANVVAVVGDVIGPIAELTGGVIDMAGGLKDAIPNINAFGHEWERAGGPIRTVIENVKGMVGAEEEIPPATDAATAAVEAQTDALGLEAQAAAEAAAAQADFVAALQDEVAALEASSKAHGEKADAQRAAADAQFAMTDAQAEFNEQLAGLDEALKESEGSVLKQQQAYDDLTESAIGVADSALRVAKDNAKAEGASVNFTEALDIQNAALLEQANKAAPEAARQILNYVADVNNIPREAVTDILTILDEQGLAAAETEIALLSGTRQMTIQADLDAAQAEGKNRELHNAVEQPATMPIDGDPSGGVAAVGEVKDAASAASALVSLGADPTQANEIIADVASGDYSSLVELFAAVEPAEDAIADLVGAEHETTVTTLADTANATNDLLNLITAARVAKIYASLVNGDIISGQIDNVARTRTAKINADANTASAEKELNNVARTRTARINAAVSRSNVLVRVDGGG